jgi:hypothetical protein
VNTGEWATPWLQFPDWLRKTLAVLHRLCTVDAESSIQQSVTPLYVGNRMKASFRFVLVCLCAVFPVLAIGQNPSTLQIDVKNLDAHIDHFLAYDQELAKMRSTIASDEAGIVDALNQDVTQTTDHLMAIETMINMFNSIQCKLDRGQTRPILLAYLGLNSEYSEKQAKRVTSTASQSKTPAITQIASKIQNELHSSILTLKTIAITIQFDATGK